MIIKTKPSWSLPRSSVTPESVFRNRRAFMAGTLAATAGLVLPPLAHSGELPHPGQDLQFRKMPGFSTDEKQTPYADATGYNNFYEFGTDKRDPARYADAMQTSPWSVAVEGACDKPGTYALEDLLKPHDYQERIYRHRCVEAWSMVVPWIGVPLADMLRRFEPTAQAKYVYFETLNDPEQMRGQRSTFSTIDWPYQEGLRMDEAMNELGFMAVGLYGKTLPNQNGAPMRLVVPWKYGFKSIKSIVRIRFQEKQPPTTWSRLAPNEYGFYANVNPNVDHPRWSQKRERRLPSDLFSANWVDTRLFNGYEEQVAGLYKGMDLRQYF